jgi:hypothetical protein
MERLRQTYESLCFQWQDCLGAAPVRMHSHQLRPLAQISFGAKTQQSSKAFTALEDCCLEFFRRRSGHDEALHWHRHVAEVIAMERRVDHFAHAFEEDAVMIAEDVVVADLHPDRAR